MGRDDCFAGADVCAGTSLPTFDIADGAVVGLGEACRDTTIPARRRKSKCQEASGDARSSGT